MCCVSLVLSPELTTPSSSPPAPLPLLPPSLPTRAPPPLPSSLLPPPSLSSHSRSPSPWLPAFVSSSLCLGFSQARPLFLCTSPSHCLPCSLPPSPSVCICCLVSPLPFSAPAFLCLCLPFTQPVPASVHLSVSLSVSASMAFLRLSLSVSLLLSLSVSVLPRPGLLCLSLPHVAHKRLSAAAEAPSVNPSPPVGWPCFREGPGLLLLFTARRRSEGGKEEGTRKVCPGNTGEGRQKSFVAFLMSQAWYQALAPTPFFIL